MIITYTYIVCAYFVLFVCMYVYACTLHAFVYFVIIVVTVAALCQVSLVHNQLINLNRQFHLRIKAIYRINVILSYDVTLLQ